MKFKRGVSFYSFQQSQFFKEMNWKDMIKYTHELGCDGVEIIDEQTIPNYPNPSDEFVTEWNNEIKKYGLRCALMDVFLDVHQFRDHVMTYDEAAERLKNDLRLAKKLGFEAVRCLCLVPIEVIEKALPLAEELDIKIGKEIHAPFTIKTKGSPEYTDPLFKNFNPKMTEEIVDLIHKTGSKHVGLVPDFGIFQNACPRVQREYEKRHCNSPEMVDFIFENRFTYSLQEMGKLCKENWPNHDLPERNIYYIMQTKSSATAEELRDIVPYIVSIHGKFYEMTFNEKLQSYNDEAIDYFNPIQVLVEEGYQGFICSEYEGQRHQQDTGRENLPNEKEEVKRHQEMLVNLGNYKGERNER